MASIVSGEENIETEKRLRDEIEEGNQQLDPRARAYAEATYNR